jgi:hypothetical protein
MRRLLLFLVLVVLTGCFNYAKQWTPIMEASVGHNVQEYITMWGPPEMIYPKMIYEDSPNKVYYWSTRNFYRTLTVTPEGKIVNWKLGVKEHVHFPGDSLFWAE